MLCVAFINYLQVHTKQFCYNTVYERWFLKVRLQMGYALLNLTEYLHSILYVYIMLIKNRAAQKNSSTLFLTDGNGRRRITTVLCIFQFNWILTYYVVIYRKLYNIYTAAQKNSENFPTTDSIFWNWIFNCVISFQNSILNLLENISLFMLGIWFFFLVIYMSRFQYLFYWMKPFKIIYSFSLF